MRAYGEMSVWYQRYNFWGQNVFLQVSGHQYWVGDLKIQIRMVLVESGVMGHQYWAGSRHVGTDRRRPISILLKLLSPVWLAISGKTFNWTPSISAGPNRPKWNRSPAPQIHVMFLKWSVTSVNQKTDIVVASLLLKFNKPGVTQYSAQTTCI